MLVQIKSIISEIHHQIETPDLVFKDETGRVIKDISTVSIHLMSRDSALVYVEFLEFDKGVGCKVTKKRIMCLKGGNLLLKDIGDPKEKEISLKTVIKKEPWHIRICRGIIKKYSEKCIMK